MTSRNELFVEKLNNYQIVQHKHDRNYHPDILSLGVLGRMKHIILHLIKYRAKLSPNACSEVDNLTALVDTFIMLVSSSNTLGIQLSKKNVLTEKITMNSDFLEQYIQTIGEMAKAAESADHQEDYPINSSWREKTIFLLNMVMIEANTREIDILELSKTRLNEVEENHSLHFILKDIA